MKKLVCAVLLFALLSPVLAYDDGPFGDILAEYRRKMDEIAKDLEDAVNDSRNGTGGYSSPSVVSDYDPYETDLDPYGYNDFGGSSNSSVNTTTSSGYNTNTNNCNWQFICYDPDSYSNGTYLCRFVDVNKNNARLQSDPYSYCSYKYFGFERKNYSTYGHNGLHAECHHNGYLGSKQWLTETERSQCRWY